VRVDVYDRNGRRFAHGSGFIVSQDGVIATNLHIIEGASSAKIVFVSGLDSSVQAVVAVDKKADLVLLKTEDTNLVFLELAGSALPAIGSKVFTISTPKERDFINSLSEGLVSGHRVVGD